MASIRSLLVALCQLTNLHALLVSPALAASSMRLTTRQTLRCQLDHRGTQILDPPSPDDVLDEVEQTLTRHGINHAKYRVAVRPYASSEREDLEQEYVRPGISHMVYRVGSVASTVWPTSSGEDNGELSDCSMDDLGECYIIGRNG
jgi:hypothetical protein